MIKINLLPPDLAELAKQMFRDDLKQQKANKTKKTEGMTCKKCNLYNEYAESNQDDGTYICYKCRPAT